MGPRNLEYRVKLRIGCVCVSTPHVTRIYQLGPFRLDFEATLTDLGLVNAQLAQPVTAANFLKDVNASGTLSLADKGITNANLTKALAAP